LFLVGGAVYLRQPYSRLSTNMKRLGGASALDWQMAWILIPVIRVVGDIAKMLGYPVGWVWRLRHRPPDWRQI